MPRSPIVSKLKGFTKGDLVWLDKKFSIDDNIYRVESVTHRDTFPSLLKLRLVLRTFYSNQPLDAFHYYDETLCVFLEVSHIEEMQARYGRIIKDIYDLHAGNKKEVTYASTDSPRKRASRRKALEPEGDQPTSPRRSRKKAV
jgi:hypothetical protein